VGNSQDAHKNFQVGQPVSYPLGYAQIKNDHLSSYQCQNYPAAAGQPSRLKGCPAVFRWSENYETNPFKKR
jgi:hypothetical protein